LRLRDKFTCSEDVRNRTSFIETRSIEGERLEMIKGTDIPVWKIVKLHLAGTGVSEIKNRYSELEEREIRGAISYYYCNRRRVERQLDRNE